MTHTWIKRVSQSLIKAQAIILIFKTPYLDMTGGHEKPLEAWFDKAGFFSVNSFD